LHAAAFFPQTYPTSSFAGKSIPSPGINASLRGATVFFQWQSSHTTVKGLGFIGMDTFSWIAMPQIIL
jgi:hypothetical protein